MLLPLWLGACASPSTAVPPPAASAPAEPASETVEPAPVAPPAAAPEAPAAWNREWNVVVVSDTPAEDGAKSLAAGLGKSATTWAAAQPGAPGVTYAVWVGSGADVSALAAHRTGGSDLVAVLGPGDAQWAARAAERLTEGGISVLDTAATASLWMDPEALDGTLAGALAARSFADRYVMPFFPSSPLVGSFPPGVVVMVGAHDGAAASADTAPTRAELARAGAVGEATDPEVAVRIGVAASSKNAEVLATLSTDREPLVRARVASRSTVIETLRALAEDASSVVRLVATNRLTELPDDAAGVRQMALSKAAHSHDAAQRWKAAAALGDVALLTTLLRDTDSHVRQAAASRLGEIGGKEAIVPLAAALREPDYRLRLAAAGALAAIHDPAAAAALSASLADPTASVAAKAASGRSPPGAPQTDHPPISPPRSEEEIERAVTSHDAEVRIATAQFMNGRADDPALSWLDRLARDPDPAVRYAAVRAFGADPLSAPRVIAALGDADPDVVLVALAALARGKHGKAEVLAPLTTNPDAEIRLRAFEALAALGRSDTLRAGLTDPDERIRAAAVGVFPGDLSPGEPAVLVQRAAAHGRTRPGGDALLADAGDLGFWARGTLSREDEFLAEILAPRRISAEGRAPVVLMPTHIWTYGRRDHG